MNGIDYQCEENMTWNEWVDSDYNVDNFCCTMFSVHPYCDGTKEIYNSVGERVYPNDMIIKNEEYIND